MTTLPHFVLFSRSEELAGNGTHDDTQGGSWHFCIKSDDGQVWLEASDFESFISRERLELLAVVRGLEALDQPSIVTLVTPNPQISRSVRQGLDYWRDRNWTWERFGEKVPMSNSDLWIRIDSALQIHEIRCRTYRIDPKQQVVPKPKLELAPKAEPQELKRPTVLLRPVVAATRLAANGLHGAANSLRRWLPESGPNTSSHAPA